MTGRAAGGPSPPASCAGCGRPLDPAVHYLMRVEFVSTPVSPNLPAPGPDDARELDRLLRQIEAQGEEQLADSVYCRDEFFVCGACRDLLRRHILLPARLPGGLLEDCARPPS